MAYSIAPIITQPVVFNSGPGTLQKVIEVKFTTLLGWLECWQLCRHALKVLFTHLINRNSSFSNLRGNDFQKLSSWQHWLCPLVEYQKEKPSGIPSIYSEVFDYGNIGDITARDWNILPGTTFYFVNADYNLGYFYNI